MKEKLLNITAQPRRKFSKHFLIVVHAEIGFSGTCVEKILEHEQPLRSFFQSKGFESSRKFIQKNLSLANTLDNTTTISHNDTPIGLSFFSQKPKREMQVLDTKIVFSDFQYEGFEKFSALFQELCEGISKFVPRHDVIKLGLRKIDSVVIDPVNSYQDACAIFNDALFANVRSGLIKEGDLKAHEETTVVERGSHLCVIRALMKKLSSPSTYEAYLDFDFIDTTRTNIDSIFTTELQELNNSHFDLFMWAASDELLSLMEER